jgi:hypothetical protein
MTGYNNTGTSRAAPGNYKKHSLAVNPYFINKNGYKQFLVHYPEKVRT